MKPAASILGSLGQGRGCQESGMQKKGFGRGYICVFSNSSASIYIPEPHHAARAHPLWSYCYQYITRTKRLGVSGESTENVASLSHTSVGSRLFKAK